MFTLQALPPSQLLTSDKGQPFVFGEVSEVLGVECRKRELIDQAAGGYPGVVVWPGTSAPSARAWSWPHLSATASSYSRTPTR
jgi:hypothetical protein